MAAVRSNNVFKYYLKVPKEVRAIMINEMQPIDRVRLSASSRYCWRETRTSKNFMNELKLEDKKGIMEIEIIFGYETGFKLRFRRVLNNKWITCEKLNGQQVWETKLEESINPYKFAIDHFKYILQFYGNIIKVLTIQIADRRTKPFTMDFEVNSLRSLETLNVDVNIPQLLSKTRNLQILSDNGIRDNDILQTILSSANADAENEAICEKIYKVQHTLKLPNNKLTYEQLLKSEATIVEVKIGALTETDISHVITHWKNGTAKQRIDKFYWNLENSNFDFSKLCELISGLVERSENGSTITINHSTIPRKYAILFVDGKVLFFIVNFYST